MQILGNNETKVSNNSVLKIERKQKYVSNTKQKETLSIATIGCVPLVELLKKTK